ncbi:hypothetical protein [Elizabethkingia sp. JS20170427COW]|uniref:hypothetical protein n=1 Tax=Elizabethkingia sp. JS20170427COW TaxID=2583851 RepID=UPI001110141E|nr:hypothetical protein [Elizabethkingia sp. JS20170427COW]QCX52375.1 hypothetical protein FGE20_00725 [Elizabethkingia sp. JS20170427COW]
MSLSLEVQQELEWINSPEFNIGEYIYMGMGKLKGRTVCLSVAYKIDYCIKKAQQFAQEDPNVSFDHINKIKIGEVKPCLRFDEVQ